MHGWGTRMLLKECLDQGVSKTELSRRFGVSRRTIYEWIETGQLDLDRLRTANHVVQEHVRHYPHSDRNGGVIRTERRRMVRARHGPFPEGSQAIEETGDLVCEVREILASHRRIAS